MDNRLKELFINGNVQLNQALLTQIVNEVQQGNYHRCKAMGITDDILKIIDSLPPTIISELAATPVVWARVSIDQATFMRIIQNNHDKNTNRELINKAIKLNASNRMLANYFGITSNMAATKRKLLGVPTAKGRLVQLSDTSKKFIWDEWKAFLHQGISIDKLRRLEKQIEIAEKYSLNLCAVHQEIETNDVKTSLDRQLFEDLIQIKADKKIIINFFNVPEHKITVAQRFIKYNNQHKLVLFKDTNEKLKDKVLREWNYLLTKDHIKNIHQLEQTHLKKLISFSHKHHLEINSLWLVLTHNLEGVC